MRYLMLTATFSFFVVVLFGAAQRTGSEARPTSLDAFKDRPVVKSPDGRFGLTVTGPEQSLEAWLTLNPSDAPGGPIQVWPVERNCEVLWRPDSNAFALTDDRYANLAYVLVFGTHFYMGESDERLGVPIEDVTPTIRKDFEGRSREHYASIDHDTLLFYSKALRWIGSDQLLVGVNAKTMGNSGSLPNGGIVDWYLGYIVDVPHKGVMRELDSGQMQSEYGIDLKKQIW